MSTLAASPPTAPRYYIGGGNVAGILGVSPYRSPLDEFLTIVGAQPEPSPERIRFFNRRKALEPFAAEAFTEATGRTITHRNRSYQHPNFPHLRAELDFEVDDGGSGETKTVHSLAVREWGESDGEIPVYVEAQVQHGLGVSGKSHAWVHALVGLDEDRIYRVERDDELIAGCTFRLDCWWKDHVLTGVAPEPTTIEDLRALYPQDSGAIATASDEISCRVLSLKLAKIDAKVIEKDIEELALLVKLAMRGASTLVDHRGKPLATWKAQGAVRFQEKEFEIQHPELYAQFKRAGDPFRVLRLK